MPPPPPSTPEPLVDFLGSCLRVEPSERPTVEELATSGWLKGGGGDTKQPVLAFLMRAAAKRMAQKVIDM